MNVMRDELGQVALKVCQNSHQGHLLQVPPMKACLKSRWREATWIDLMFAVDHGGDNVNYDKFDRFIFDRALKKRLGFNDLTGNQAGYAIREARTTEGMLRLVSQNPNALSWLAQYTQNNKRSGLRIFERVVNSGQAYALSKAVEAAKIKLSSRTTATVELVRPDAGINIRQEVKREDFESAIGKDLDQIFETINYTLEDAGITAKDVDQVILTGGSCQIPAFKRRVQAKFRASKISDASVASRVSLGLAAEARRLWA